MIASLLIKLHEGEKLSSQEQELVHKTLQEKNVSLHEAVALNLWSSNAPAIQEQLLCGNTYNYVSRTLETLANQLWHLTPDGEEVRYVLEALQNICYANTTLSELYEKGRSIALPGMTTSVLSAMRKIHIAVNAEDIAALIYAAMHKHPLKEEITVYRAIQGKVIGPSVMNRGFVSTSLTKKDSFIKYPGYNVLFELKVPAETHCIDIVPFSNYDTVENEILLPPNIIEIQEQTTDGHNIYVKGMVHEIKEFA